MEKVNAGGPAEANALFIERELEWLSGVINARLEARAGRGQAEPGDSELPDAGDDDSPYAGIVRNYGFDWPERLVLILSLAPHTRPDILDVFFVRNEYDRGVTEFGGILGTTHGGFIPTGETALFLLAGHDMALRLRLEPLFGPTHVFNRCSILQLGETRAEEPYLSGPLILSREYKELLTSGQHYRPVFSANFPARLISTPLEWKDLTLENSTRMQINEILTWIRHEGLLMNGWGLSRTLKKGYRCLFYGPSGTGKTLTATLLGKVTGKDVYRADLSMMISKYIGETEKNLSGLFDQAENKGWILFFDEAESLFGKRVEANTSNDRSANQQIAYLLQRLEDYNGVVILASNFESGLDEAFTRRFESMVHFPSPDADQRLQLWENYFRGQRYGLEQPELLPAAAEKFELSGGKIINVLRYCCIKAVERGAELIKTEELLYGIRRELYKDGKTVQTTIQF